RGHHRGDPAQHHHSRLPPRGGVMSSDPSPASGHLPGPGRRLPVSTYRLQLGPNLGFAEAAAVVPYLARLGATDLYLSPVLEAAPGSTHGYDVVDHSRVSASLGGREELERLCTT